MSTVIGRNGWMVAVCLALALVAGAAMPAHAESPMSGAAGASAESSQMPGILTGQGASLLDGGVRVATASEAPFLLAQTTTSSRPGGAAQKGADEWRVIVTPINFWAFEVHGDVAARGVKRDVDVSFSDIQDHLDWSIGGRVEVGRGPWSVYFSGAYLAFKEDNVKGPTGSGLKADIESDWAIVEFGGVYRLAAVPLGATRLLVDGLAGARYIHTDLEIKANDDSFDKKANIDFIDPLVGLRLRLPITEAFSVGVAGNVGGFGLSSNQSHFSWAFNADLSYKWQISKAWALNFAGGYSILDFNYDGGNPNKHDLDIQMRGPFLAVSIVF